MILDFLEATLGSGTRHDTKKGTQYSYYCPFCGDHRERLFVNIDTHVYWCHNCESTGSTVTFISNYSGISWYDALSVFREYESYERVLPDDLREEIYSKLLPVAHELKKDKHIHPLPEEFILLENARGKSGQRAVDYIRSRGITMAMAERYYIGYCREGDYANRIIMPDFEQGELIYWQARTWEPAPTNKMLKKFYRKVLNPSLTKDQIEQGIKSIDKSEVLGNIDFVLEQGMAVICEGKMDQYTIGDAGVCLHGKHMSDMQFMKLVSNKDKIHAVTVMLDGDALKQAVVVADALYKHFDDVFIAKLPKDADPNSLGRKGVLDALVGAIKYNEMFQVKARLKGWT